MAEAKFISIIAGLLGVPMSILGIVENIDNWKSAALFIAVLITIMVHLFYFIIWGNQKTRMRDLDIEERELKLKEAKEEYEKD